MLLSKRYQTIIISSIAIASLVLVGFAVTASALTYQNSVDVEFTINPSISINLFPLVVSLPIYHPMPLHLVPSQTITGVTPTPPTTVLPGLVVAKAIPMLATMVSH